MEFVPPLAGDGDGVWELSPVQRAQYFLSDRVTGLLSFLTENLSWVCHSPVG